MSSNNITGDNLISKSTTDLYRSGFDLIWGPKQEPTGELVSIGETKTDSASSVASTVSQ